MAIKDLDSSENKSLSQSSSGEFMKQGNGNKDLIKTDSAADEVVVKNAHAVGDGSYGRNDGSVPEEEPKEDKDDNTY